MTTVTVNTRADYAAFLLRVTMGIFFLVHAGLKCSSSPRPAPLASSPRWVYQAGSPIR
jgi:hypothetical protein